MMMLDGIVPAALHVLPANHYFMETVGIEPTKGFRRMSRDQLPIPLHDAQGVTIAYAVIDAIDARFAEYRYYLDSDSRPGGKQYARRTTVVDGQRRATYLHRDVVGLLPGDPRIVDHANGLTLDNRRANLRICTHGENAQNQPTRRSNKSSRYRGVTWDKSRGRWMARVMLAGVPHTLGRFDSEHEAGAVAAAWRAEHMPFANAEREAG